MLKEFKEFVSRGNLIELAVAVILGLAFAAVVNAFTEGIIGGFIGLIFGGANFDAWNVHTKQRGDDRDRDVHRRGRELPDRGVRVVPGHQGLQPRVPQGERGRGAHGGRAAHRDPGRAAAPLISFRV